MRNIVALVLVLLAGCANGPVYERSQQPVRIIGQGESAQLTSDQIGYAVCQVGELECRAPLGRFDKRDCRCHQQ